jgi:hypothetical protein
MRSRDAVSNDFIIEWEEKWNTKSTRGDIEPFYLPNLLRRGFLLDFPLAEWTGPSLLNQNFPHDVQ